MLLFSEYLRELLKNKQMSVSSLARAIGVERTQLSKALSGHRVLPYHLLEELAYYLRLTPGEEKKLRSYYDEQFEKEGTRRSHELIDKLFHNLSCLDFSSPAFEETRLLINLEQDAGERTIFLGETNVQFLLRMVLSEEMSRPDARLELTVPPSDSFLVTELLHRYMDDKITMEISQIICFDAGFAQGGDINLHNLESFCRILPICLLSGQHYHPYYYYDSSVPIHYTDPFPYFMVTHSCVICLSEDGSCALLLRSPDAISCYQRHFQSLADKSHSLIQYTSDPLEILSSYQKCTGEDGFYMAMDQPCFGRFYSEDFVRAHLRQELPGFTQILSAATDRFTLLRAVPHFYTFFTESGVRRFMADGTLDDYPVEIVKPFSPQVRCLLMRQMSGAIQNGDIIGHIFNEGIFPDYLAMCTSAEKGIGFFTTRQFPLSDGLCSVRIREPNLCFAFHGWMTHLPGSNLTWTAKETAETLDRLVESGT